MLQRTGQSMTSYIELLRLQATKCRFGSFEDEACKGQLVLGVLDNSLRKRFPKEDDLSFKKKRRD